MLFRKKIDRYCTYCQFAGKIDDETMVCQFCGIVPSDHRCRRFRYYQGDFLSSFTTYGYLRKTGQILSHIQHNSRRVYCSFGRFGSSHHLF